MFSYETNHFAVVFVRIPKRAPATQPTSLNDAQDDSAPCTEIVKQVPILPKWSESNKSFATDCIETNGSTSEVIKPLTISLLEKQSVFENSKSSHRLCKFCDSYSCAHSSSHVELTTSSEIAINYTSYLTHNAKCVSHRLPNIAFLARLLLVLLLLLGSGLTAPTKASPYVLSTSNSSSFTAASSGKHSSQKLSHSSHSSTLYANLNGSASYGRATELWAVELHTDDERVAAEIAKKHGFIYHGRILPGIYHFKKPRLKKRSTTMYFENPDATLKKDPTVKWLRQQRSRVRVKRSIISGSAPFHLPSSFTLDDPKWPKMWYLNRDKLNMNVKPAWLKGYAGQGVVVSILDDGLERDHPDLRANYDPLASYDVLNNDPDPQPRYEPQDENKHGTRCAGEVASVANNSECSVGVAFMAKVGGIRMIDGEVTDSIEAAGLGRNIHHIDIFSVSWGPTDDGKTMEAPGELAQKAFYTGVTEGRGGLGSIYVWASGNGGRYFDNCNCDGYANSIYTLTVSSVAENGRVPWYAENCPAILAVTYSSGDNRQRAVVTTDLHHGCTENHTGTSASAPLAAGIVALALSANRRLTWRDMQHIVIRTARHDVLDSAAPISSWKPNGVGRPVSHFFGYGLMDAAAMVELAKNWTTVPAQHVCEVPAPMMGGPITLEHKGNLKLRLTTDACVTDVSHHIRYLEHVQVKVSLRTTHRGKLEIYLRSPAGTVSKLLGQRGLDFNAEGFHRWPFMTVHFWGERPNGTWFLTVFAHESRVSFDEWSVVFYGTATDPTNPDDVDDEAVTPENKGPIGCARVLTTNWAVCLGLSLLVSLDVIVRALR